jgi:hypothetical protein
MNRGREGKKFFSETPKSRKKRGESPSGLVVVLGPENVFPLLSRNILEKIDSACLIILITIFGWSPKRGTKAMGANEAVTGELE